MCRSGVDDAMLMGIPLLSAVSLRGDTMGGGILNLELLREAIRRMLRAPQILCHPLLKIVEVSLRRSQSKLALSW